MSDSESESGPNKIHTASGKMPGPEQVRKMKRAALISTVSAVTLVTILASLAGTNNLKISRTIPDNLMTVGDRVAFVGKYLVIHSLWILIAIINVSIGRAKNMAFNPLDGNESKSKSAENTSLIPNRSSSIGRDHKLQSQKNILQNSMEQSLMSIGVQLGLATYMSAESLINVIPIMNILYLFGRIAFVIGYPNYRAFGFQVTFFPTLIAMFYSLYKLFATEFT